MSFLDMLKTEHKSMLNGEFSEAVTITNGDNTATVNGLVDDTFDIVDPETRTRMVSNDLRVTIWEADVLFSVRKRGITVNIRGIDHTLREYEDDRQGGITLYLD